ncbi:MAG TPA: UvrD-helicase domain-containing protein [Patescibacteria group bacterium]|nr:UvrD-helicase domain-containing protein [Patescibacteria group bacterium]
MSEKKLNKEQLEAVKHGNGPLLIIAGAGTGKTTVITERVKYLITKGLAKPEEILALTFTEKGAKEMEERIDVALPLGYGEMWVMTFHSFCDRILRDNAIHIGLDPKYKLTTEAESIDFLKRNLFELDLKYFRPLGNPNKFIEGLLQHFSRLQDECVNPLDYINWTKKIKKPEDEEEKLELQKSKELADAYKKYNDLKIKESVMDFGDLITNTLKLFRERPNILKVYQQKFKYILVDEFQDTNFAQNELAILLAGKVQNITAVADDDQAIYRWRGASVSNVIQFRSNFPRTRIIVLSRNYRSTQEILNRSYDLIQFNNPDRLEVIEKINKKLVSANNKLKKDEIKFIHTSNVLDEAEKVAKEIDKLITSKKYDYKDMAVLVRANNHAEAFIREFERRGIPNQFLGPSKLFEKEEIIDLISYLKVLCNPEDSENLYRLLSSEIFNISNITLIKLNSIAKRRSVSLFEIVAESKDEKLIKIVKLIDKHLGVMNKQSAGEILYDFINEIELFKKLVKNSEDIKTKNIAKFFEKIKAYEIENKKASVFNVVDYLDLLTEVGETPTVTDGDWQENNAVNILTVHSSKGLEFPVVFLVNLVNERFPSRERHEQIPIPDELIKEVLPKGDYHTQEERRLFYVGMTRAKEKLYFTASDYYGDAKRAKKISPFVIEALGKKLNSQLQKGKSRSIENYSVLKREVCSANTKILKIDYLSVSQIETFKDCPLHYKLKYIYKLPTTTSASISFGVSIHNTLKDFFGMKADKNKKELLNLYKQNWIEEGYLNKKHKQEFYKEGENYLLEFIKKGYDKKIKTLATEQKFILPIDKTLKIGGTIDRVDDLGGGRFEVIDYKTGANIPTQKEVDKDLQLSFYALAVSNLYNVKPEDIKLSLYYFKTQEKIITRRTKKDLDKVKEEILKIREEIEKSDFKCNNSYFCQKGCEYRMFCNLK